MKSDLRDGRFMLQMNSAEYSSIHDTAQLNVLPVNPA
jgi:hypothetical protein